jgi:hypothetical protein
MKELNENEKRVLVHLTHIARMDSDRGMPVGVGIYENRRPESIGIQSLQFGSLMTSLNHKGYTSIEPVTTVKPGLRYRTFKILEWTEDEVIENELIGNIVGDFDAAIQLKTEAAEKIAQEKADKVNAKNAAKHAAASEKTLKRVEAAEAKAELKRVAAEEKAARKLEVGKKREEHGEARRGDNARRRAERKARVQANMETCDAGNFEAEQKELDETFPK